MATAQRGDGMSSLREAQTCRKGWVPMPRKWTATRWIAGSLLRGAFGARHLAGSQYVKATVRQLFDGLLIFVNHARRFGWLGGDFGDRFGPTSLAAAHGREGEFPVEPATGHWQNPASFQRRLTGSTGNRRTRPSTATGTNQKTAPPNGRSSTHCRPTE